MPVKYYHVESAKVATRALLDARPEPTAPAFATDGVEVACGEGRVRLLRLQAPGRRMLPVGEFLRGFPIEPGQAFTS